MRLWLILALFLLGLGSCSQSDSADPVLARYHSGQITTSEFNDFLANPFTRSPQTLTLAWLEEKMAELFQMKVLINEEELLFLKTNAAFQKQLQRQTDNMLAEAYLNQVTPKFVIAEEDIQRVLSSLPPSASQEMRAIHNIFLRYPTQADAQAKAATKAKAQGLLEQIRQGAAFTQLAKAHSDSASANKGGAFGFTLKSDLREPLAGIAFSLKAGEISDVIVNDSGCHLLKVTRIVNPSQNNANSRHQVVENRLRREMEQEWASLHFTECLIEKGLTPPNWPAEPADESGIIYTVNRQSITVPEMRQASGNQSSLRATYLARLQTLVFAEAYSEKNPADAEKIREFAEQRQAYLHLRRQSFLAEIKALPEQKLYDHYLKYQKRFRTPERLAVTWHGWSIGTGNPDDYFAQAQAYFKRLNQGETPSQSPEMSETTRVMTRANFRESHRGIANRLPEILFKDQVIPPFRLADRMLVLQIAEHRPAEIIPYANLLDQVPTDYLRVHGKSMDPPWFAKTQQDHGFSLNQKKLSRFLETLQPKDAT